MERGRVRGGQQAGDVVEDPVGVGDEEVDDLGDQALCRGTVLVHRLQVLEILIHHTLDGPFHEKLEA